MSFIHLCGVRKDKGRCRRRSTAVGGDVCAAAALRAPVTACVSNCYCRSYVATVRACPLLLEIGTRTCTLNTTTSTFTHSSHMSHLEKRERQKAEGRAKYSQTITLLLHNGGLRAKTRPCRLRAIAINRRARTCLPTRTLAPVSSNTQVVLFIRQLQAMFGQMFALIPTSLPTLRCLLRRRWSSQPVALLFKRSRAATPA